MSAELILNNSLSAEVYLSRSGYEFDIYSDNWRLSKTIKVAVGAVIEILDPELHEGYRKSLGNPEEDFPNLVKYADPVARVSR